MKSSIVSGNPVHFPTWSGERIYMQEFRKDTPLPTQYARWQSTVDQLLYNIDTDGPIYLMVDQGVVKAGTTHRRSGVHVDGHWVMSSHGPRHGPAPVPGHRPPGGHIGFSDVNELLVLASDVQACRAYVGDYTRDFVADWRGGDCSNLDLSGLDAVDLMPNRGYIGDVFTLHESVPVPYDCQRTLVRLNVVLQ